MKRILIIEDEVPISELIRMNLHMAGFETCQAYDGEEGIKYIRTCRFELIILDLMLPKLSGYQLLPVIRERDIPVIMLTAKSSLADRVGGLNAGADDYMVKPFEGVELLARIHALLRRYEKEENMKSFDGIEVHFECRKVIKDSVEVELTPKEFDLLKVLVQNRGIALSRQKLLELVWEYDYEGGTRTVDMHIQKLRSKLDTDLISTVYKIGYRLEHSL